MKRFPLLVLAILGLASFAAAQNQPPVVTAQLPDVTVHAGASPRFVDALAGFRDPDVSNAVRMTTVLGGIDIALYGDQKPITVTNFLRYVNEGRYFVTDPTTAQQASSFVHRSVPGFVIQGGGFIATVNPSAPANLQPTSVLTYPPIQNEPGISNLRGTIAMAKTSDPNSATSQWFINLANNTSLNDPGNSGGFTVFGRVVNNTMSVVDAIAAVPVRNFGGAFSELPVMNYTSPNNVRPENTVRVTAIDIIAPMNFSASSDNPGVATATASGRNILVKGISAGNAVITVTATDFDGASVSQSFRANVIAGAGRLANISTRGFVGRNDDVMIGGFIVKGTTPKRVLIRAVGPSLTQYGVAGALNDPQISVRNRAGTEIGSNDNWETSADRQTFVDYELAPQFSQESAVLLTLDASPEGTAYTAIMRGANNSTGVGLIEVYDVDSAPSSFLTNISTRGRVQLDDQQMIAGVIVRGGESKRVLVRAVGPSLTQYGVPEALQDPTVRLLNANAMVIRENDNWRDNQETDIRATNMAPTFDAESALIETLPPGNYTAIVSGKNRTVGNGLVEVFQLN